jgi:hypothetical protein
MDPMTEEWLHTCTITAEKHDQALANRSSSREKYWLLLTRCERAESLPSKQSEAYWPLPQKRRRSVAVAFSGDFRPVRPEDDKRSTSDDQQVTKRSAESVPPEPRV